MMLIAYPLKVIEYLLGFIIAARGAFFVYTYFSRLGDSLLVDVVGFPGIVLVVGIAMLACGLSLLWSLVAERTWVEEYSLFFSSTLFMFISFLNLISDISRPFTWVYPLTLAAIASIAWLHSKTKRTLNEQDEISSRRQRERNRPGG